MMGDRRRLVGQVLLAFVALTTLLPWIREDSPAPAFNTNSVVGFRLSSGVVVLVLAIAGIILAQINFKTVWMTAGLAVAVVLKAILDSSSDDHSSPLVGVWLALALGVLAAIALVTQMLRDSKTNLTGA